MAKVNKKRAKQEKAEKKYQVGSRILRKISTGMKILNLTIISKA